MIQCNCSRVRELMMSGYLLEATEGPHDLYTPHRFPPTSSPSRASVDKDNTTVPKPCRQCPGLPWIFRASHSRARLLIGCIGLHRLFTHHAGSRPTGAWTDGLSHSHGNYQLPLLFLFPFRYGTIYTYVYRNTSGGSIVDRQTCRLGSASTAADTSDT